MTAITLPQTHYRALIDDLLTVQTFDFTEDSDEWLLWSRLYRAALVKAPTSDLLALLGIAPPPLVVRYVPEVEFRIVDGSTKWSRFRPETDVFTAVETARRLTAAYPAFVLAWRVVRGDGVIVAQSVSERQEAA